MKGVKKQHLPEKRWDAVKVCSDRCRMVPATELINRSYDDSFARLIIH